MEQPPRKRIHDILGVPPLATTGQQRLVATAIDVFYRNGFSAVGVDRIIAEAGVTKTTFYKHFDSKEDLIVAAVRQRDVWERSAWQRIVRERAGDDPAGQMLAWVDLLDEWFNAEDYRGCMFTNAAAEFPNPHDPIHRVAAEHMQLVRRYWTEVLHASATSSDTIEKLLDAYLSMIEGTLLIRQTSGRNDAARAIRPGVEQLLRAFLGAPGDRKATRTTVASDQGAQRRAGPSSST